MIVEMKSLWQMEKQHIWFLFSEIFWCPEWWIREDSILVQKETRLDIYGVLCVHLEISSDFGAFKFRICITGDAIINAN